MSTIRSLSLAFATSLLLPSIGFSQGAFDGAPEGFIPPPLHPENSDLITQELGEGVYALLSSQPPIDNSGFIVGENGVLVIDAHVNGRMANLIQTRVREVTDLPILYLVNTNHHGDHTFGNAFFPDETQIIAHSETARIMVDFEEEKELILAGAGGRTDFLDGVELRLPDITFEDRMTIDLGGRIVELHHFGHANTAGDVVVYSRDARAAWTGNFIVGAEFIPPVFEPVTRSHLAATTAMAQTLDVDIIIPGHGRPTDATMLTRYAAYLTDLISKVRAEMAKGDTDGLRIVRQLPLDPRWYPAEGTPERGFLPFIEGLHRMNVLRTFQDLSLENS
ncbi:MAG: MBL fold metallo-hydrolase [Rhodobacter sp.]|nr:MBL fold metallo-hydrolase [Rhodobacter sp.]